MLRAASITMMLLVLSPLISTASIWMHRKEAHRFAADWDKQDSILKAAKQSGVTDVTVKQIWDFQSRIKKGSSDLHLRTDAGFWINEVTAAYYGLRSVRATEDVSDSP